VLARLQLRRERAQGGGLLGEVRFEELVVIPDVAPGVIGHADADQRQAVRMRVREPEPHGLAGRGGAVHTDDDVAGERGAADGWTGPGDDDGARGVTSDVLCGRAPVHPPSTAGWTDHE
jgi:hypothetical protein